MFGFVIPTKVGTHVNFLDPRFHGDDISFCGCYTTTKQDARNILFNITGGTELTMHEVATIAGAITKTIDSRAKIKFGVTIDENIGDSVKVTVIATDMNKIRFQPLDKPHSYS